METTFNKTAVISIKNQIKSEAEIQKALKNQRKTVKLKGERVMDPKEASWKVFLQSQKLRILYAAYGLMRGKKLSQIENNHPEENHPLSKYANAINKCIEVHSKEEVVTT
jgi:hypothetical protein